MKRNLTLMLSSLLLSGSALAGLQQKFEDNKFSEPQGDLTSNVTLPVHGIQAAASGSNLMCKAPVFTDVITEVEGTVQPMRKACAGYFMFWGSSLMPYEDILASDVVYGDNNEVYFLNILSKIATGNNSTFKSYVKGTIEGDKVVINLPQTVMLINTNEDDVYDGYNLCVLDYTEMPSENPEEEMQYTYVCNEKKASVYYTIGEDGSLTLEDLGENNILGLAYCSDNTWAGYGDFYQIYTPIKATEATMPAGVKTETYGYTGDYSAYTDYADYTGYFTNIAVDGDTLYIQGIFNERPDAVITAQLDGDVAHVAQDQLVFIYADKYFMTTKIMVESTYVDENGEEQQNFILADPEMTYDLKINRETKEISSVNPDIYLIVNAYDDRVYYYEALKDFTMRYQANANGVPMNPHDVEYAFCRDDAGYDVVSFYPCNLSTDGNVLVADDMYYRIFIDDELFGFELGENDEYQYIPADEVWTEIPMFYNNFRDFFYLLGTKVEVGIYLEDVITVGVQFVYIHNGIVTESEIVTIDVDDPNSVDSIDMNAVSSEYFDLAGQRVSNPEKGIYVKRCVMSDGSSKISKVMVK